MADATGVTVSVRLAANATDRTTGELTDCEFAASGTTITFPGYRAVYVASKEETGDDDAENEALLPPLTQGDEVPIASIEPNGHTTSPPARYTEASLVKRLEELGHRPSVDVGVDHPDRPGPRLRVEEGPGARADLDRVRRGPAARRALRRPRRLRLHRLDRRTTSTRSPTGDARRTSGCKRFYFGDTGDGDTEPISAEAGFGDDALLGLKRLVEENLDEIDAAEINTFPLGPDDDGELIVVKPGKYGPYVKRGDDTASVPDDLTPDELTVAKAIELLAAPKSDEPIGELDGYPVYAKNGRYGPYVQWGDHDDPPPGLEKPKMSSLFKTMVLERITMDEAEALLQLPRHLGDDPSDGVPIYANNGRYGPYVQKEKDYRNIDSEDQLLQITLAEALAIFSQPKVYKRGGGNMAAKGPLKEFGTDPVSERPVVAKDGRFGVYVTDGETNASLGKGDRLEEMAPERAYELLAIRREAIIAKGGPTKKKRAAEEEGTGQEEGRGEEVGGEEEGRRRRRSPAGDHRHLRVTPLAMSLSADGRCDGNVVDRA